MLKLKRLRFLRSPSFFIAWGIAFAFLLGLLSSLAQLFPDVRPTFKISGTLIIVSGIIGAVYAFRKSPEIHLSVEDLLPEENAGEATLSLECSSDRNVIAQVLDLAKRSYPNVDPPSLNRYQQFVDVNATLLVCLLNSTREVVGYFDIYPLKAEFCNLLYRGKVGELDVRAEQILPPEEARLAKRLYLAGFAVERPSTVKGKRYAVILCWGLIKYLQHFYEARSDREIFAAGVTGQGETILRRFGFKFHSPGNVRKDPYPMFEPSWTPNLLVGPNPGFQTGRVFVE